MSRKPDNEGVVSRIKTSITITNAFLLGALYWGREVHVDDIIEHPFLAALGAGATIFVTIFGAFFTQFFAGFRITNVMMMIANAGIILRALDTPVASHN